MYVHGIRRLFAFAEYVIDKVTMASDVTQVFLRRDRRFRLRCPACGGACLSSHFGVCPPFPGHYKLATIAPSRSAQLA